MSVMTRDRVSVLHKVSLVLRTWFWFATAWTRLRRRPIPVVVAGLAVMDGPAARPVAPRRLGRIVARSLSIGPFRVRCLFTSIVLFRLLRAQGDEAQLVIGLPLEPRDKDAHAWVELAGRDVGPPPGRGQHVELARYG